MRGIAFHQHLYTQIVGGDESDELERWLGAEFEAPAESAIKLAIADQPMTADDWHALIRFAFAQDVRTPARLRDFLRRQAQELPVQMERVVRQAVEQVDRDGRSILFGRTTKSDGFPLTLSLEAQADGSGLLKAETAVGRKLWHWALRHFLTSTIDKISYKGWSILKAAPKYSWPTSDNPLIRLSYTSPSQYDFNGGWGVPNGDVLLPLSPTHLLHHCVGRRSFERGYQLDSVTSERVRRIIIEHADRYVFAKDEFDIHKYRTRVISAQVYAAERATWKNWPIEQAQLSTEGSS